jgi:putative DNA primase/helicase
VSYLKAKKQSFGWDEIERIAFQNLEAKHVGAGFISRCSAHEDKNPSLSGRKGDDGKALLKCFAGCDFHEIIEGFRKLAGHSSSCNYRPRISSPAAKSTAEDEAKREHALQLWQATRPLADSPRAQRYFESRGLYGVNSRALRFHPSLSHLTKQRFPGIVAKVSALDGSFLAIQRTYLAHEGAGKAPVGAKQAKLALGNMQDGAVQLAAAGPTLMIGEGIETCLSAMQATGLPAWASLGAKRMAKIKLPEQVREIIILADNDETGAREAQQAGRRWLEQGKRVRIAMPPAPGADFNDMLKAEAAQ